MNVLIKRIWRMLLNNSLVSHYHSIKLWQHVYKKMAKVSKTPINKKCKGEDEYINKWKKISKHVSPIDYRLFSQFIGNNPNIVPEYVLHNVIEPIFLPRAYQQFYNDKNMYDKLLPKEYLAKSVFRCIDGIYCDGGYNIIKSENINNLALYCCDFDKIIVKPTRDTGNGSRILLYQKQGNLYVPIEHEQEFSIKNLTNYYDGNFVIQECLKQSAFTAQFNPTSVNTFRVFTYKSVESDEVHVLGIAFRIGKQNTIVDNSHAGGKYIGVLHDGKFANPCVFDPCGNKYSSFNGIDFSKQQFSIPNFESIIDFSKSIAEKIFHNKTLDLDVMIDSEENPKLIEFNVDMCSPWFYQFTTGPVFGQYTDEVIDFVYEQIHQQRKP